MIYLGALVERKKHHKVIKISSTDDVTDAGQGPQNHQKVIKISSIDDATTQVRDRKIITK